MRHTLLFIFLSCSVLTIAQTGGKNVFPFLELAYNARSAGLGRNLITTYDADVNQGVQNPASFNKKMDNTIGFNQALHAGGINHGMVAYGKHFKGVGTGAIHLRYVAYGRMDRMDEQGIEQGTFSAGDFALGGSFARRLNPRISVGATFNIIWSQLESYSSMGLSLDLAGNYLFENERTQLSAVVRNAGVQLTRFAEEDRKPLLTQPMLGISHRLEHAPFRISVIAHHLNQWDLTYTDPNAEPTIDPLTGDEIPVERAGFGEKLARHFLFQVEILAGKTLRLRGAFDYHQRRQMLVQNRPGMGGFSFGAGLQFKRFDIDYGLFIFSSAGFNNLISLTTNFDKWKK
ncbi:MAG: type IX secretion system protein PorQ [Bacteroidota bacterium]